MRKNQRGFASIIFILIIVGLIGVVGFFMFQNSQSKQGVTQARPTPTSTSSLITPEPLQGKTGALEEIETLSVDSWKEAINDGVSFKIPSEASCNNEGFCSQVSYSKDYQGHSVLYNIYVKIQDYTGGSRREQFLTTHTEVNDCQPIYKEVMVGSVRALQIAIDGGLCQGASGGIVIVVGNKLVILDGGLTYNPDTKEISRWPIRDTLISTLKASK